MGKTYLVIASSVKQLSESFEYLNHFCSATDAVDIVLIGNLVKASDIAKLAKGLKSSRILSLFTRHLPVSALDLPYNILKFRKWAKKEYDEALFSNFLSARQRWIISITSYKRIVLITDGSILFTVADYRRKGYDPLQKKNRLTSPKKIDSLIFFTTYDIGAFPADTVLKYSYADKQDTQYINELHFVGSPLVDIEKITPEELFEAIRKLKATHQEDVIYYLHPREKGNYVESLRKICKVVDFSSPYEERFLNGPRPKKIATFYSSALINLMPVDNSINFYFIDLLHLVRPRTDDDYYQRIERVYDYIKSQQEIQKHIFII